MANVMTSLCLACQERRNLCRPFLPGNKAGEHSNGSAHWPTPGHRRSEQWKALNKAFSSPSFTFSRSQFGMLNRAMHRRDAGFRICMYLARHIVQSRQRADNNVCRMSWVPGVRAVLGSVGVGCMGFRVCRSAWVPVVWAVLGSVSVGRFEFRWCGLCEIPCV